MRAAPRSTTPADWASTTQSRTCWACLGRMASLASPRTRNRPCILPLSEFRGTPPESCLFLSTLTQMCLRYFCVLKLVPGTVTADDNGCCDMQCYVKRSSFWKWKPLKGYDLNLFLKESECNFTFWQQMCVVYFNENLSAKRPKGQIYSRSH